MERLTECEPKASGPSTGPSATTSTSGGLRGLTQISAQARAQSTQMHSDGRGNGLEAGRGHGLNDGLGFYFRKALTGSQIVHQKCQIQVDSRKSRVHNVLNIAKPHEEALERTQRSQIDRSKGAYKVHGNIGNNIVRGDCSSMSIQLQRHLGTWRR